MHGSQTARRPWIPSRDWEAVWALVDRWPGLRAEHDETWLLLCRLCPDGRRAVQLRMTALIGELEATRGRPVSPSQVSRRLTTLASAGLLHWSLSRGMLRIGLHDPRRVLPQARLPLPASRGPQLGPTAQRQPGLWQDTPRLRVFDGAAHPEPVPDVPPEPEPVPLPEPEPVPDARSEPEPVPVVKSPKTASPPGEAGGETPRATQCPSQSPPPQSSILKETKKYISHQSSKNSTNSTNQPIQGSPRSAVAVAGAAKASEEAGWRALVSGACQIEDLERDEALRIIAGHCRTVVNDPKTDAFLFERAATLVVDFGVYVRELHHVLERIVESRRAGRFSKPGKSPGRVFNVACRDLGRLAGVDLWTGRPKRSKHRGRSEQPRGP